MALIEVTAPAAERIRELLEKEGKQESHGLRLKVVGGGCSGLSYSLEFDNEVGKHDKKFDSFHSFDLLARITL